MKIADSGGLIQLIYPRPDSVVKNSPVHEATDHAVVTKAVHLALSDLLSLATPEEIRNLTSDSLKMIPGVKSVFMRARGIDHVSSSWNQEHCVQCPNAACFPSENAPDSCSIAELDNIYSRLLTSNGIHMGYLFLEIEDFAAFEPFEDSIITFAHVMALTLENRWQTRILRAAHIDVTDHSFSERNFSYDRRLTDTLLTLFQNEEDLSLPHFLESSLKLAEDQTGSKVSFIYFADVDPGITWSARSKNSRCWKAYEQLDHDAKAELWTSALRQPDSEINDHGSGSDGEHSVLASLAHLDRVITVPVKMGGETSMLIGIGNKDSDYSEQDRKAIQLIGNEICRITRRRESEHGAQRLGRIIKRSKNEIYTFDAETLAFIDVNKAARENLGYTLDELLAATPMLIAPVDMPQDKFLGMCDALRSGATAKFEFNSQHRRKDGSLYPVEVRFEYIEDDRPFFLEIILDITQRQESAQMVDRYREIASNSAEMLALLSSDYVYLALNDSYAKAFGKTPHEMIGATVEQVFGREFFERVIKPQADLCLGGKEVRWQEWFDFPAAGRQFMDVSYSPYMGDDDQQQGYVVSARNITELEKARIRYKKLAYDSKERAKEKQCIFDVTEAIRTQTSNADVFAKVAICIPLGWQYPEVTRCRIHFDDSFVDSEPFEESQWKMGSKLVVDGVDRGLIEVFYLEQKPDKDFGPFIREEVELLDRITSVLSKAVQEKEASREREILIAAVEQSSESILITDQEGTIQYVNASFESMTGYSRLDAVGQNPRIFQSGEQDASFYQDMWAVLDRGEVWSGQLINKRKDGSHYSEKMSISPIRDKTGTTRNYIASKQDVTEELRLEQQLRQSLKMESIGQLAGGVAHDFNNMLGVIVGHSEMVLDQLKPDQPHFSALTEILSAANRSAALTRQLLAFARKQNISPQILDLNEGVEGMLKMLRRLIGEHIELNWYPAAKPARVKMDPSQVDQILANLIVNARDAIDHSGSVTIKTGLKSLNADDIGEIPEATPGEFVCLAISDDGCGMSQSTIEKIFEPFFTTKAVGASTGLGLSTVFGIVKQNNGFIRVFSELGSGSTFEVFLPWCSNRVSSAQDEPQTLLRSQNQETILLVEDEPALMEMIASMLRKQGYTVLTAVSPQDAVIQMEVSGAGIQLLMTDVVMPGMNGIELASRLKEISPDLKCLFMSGYAADAMGPHGQLPEGAHFIEKPFLAQTLSDKIRRAITAN